MFVAHIPAGYLLTKAIVRSTRPDYRRLMVVGLVASVAPDLDLFYHYLADRAHPHHQYVTHTPAFWLALAALATIVAVVFRRRSLILYVGVSLANVLLHLILDSVAAGVMWLYPVSRRELSLAPVPALYQPWILNFVFNWTFGLELLIVVAALVVYVAGNWRPTAAQP